MENSIYVDINAVNSKILNNDTNNEWEYRLNNGMELPTGTTIELTSSFINKKGIVGQTIEINEDVDEIITFGYYMIDTFQEQSSATAYTGARGQMEALYDLFAARNHKNVAVPDPAVPGNYYDIGSGFNIGRSENPMIAVAPFPNSNGSHNIVPVINSVNLVIKKGVYSVKQLALFITNIFNGDIQSTIDDESFIDKRIQSGDFDGLPTNNKTQSVFTYVDNTYFNTVDKATRKTDTGTKFNSLASLGKDLPFRSKELGFPSALFIKPSDAKPIMEYVKTTPVSDWGAGGNTDTMVWSNRFYDEEKTAGIQDGVGAFYTGVITSQADTPDCSYAPFGYYAGTSEFNFGYDLQSNHFNIQSLAQPRIQPTNAYMGQSMPNPGKKSIYMRRYLDDQQGNLTYVGDPAQNTDARKNQMNRALSTPMTRTSGIYIYNWAWKTSSQNADVTSTTQFGNDYFSYDDFITGDEKRREIWETTIWFRLGFSYDQLQNPNKWEQHRWYFEDPYPFAGFTTNPKISPSVLPFVANLYCPAEGGDTKEQNKDPPNDQYQWLPEFQGVQAFNMITDINTPPNAYNNNTKDGSACVYPYVASWSENMIAIPVLSDEIPTEAINLPTLSQTGYFLITSKSFRNSDIVGKATPQCILDVVPVSSLSNQDFITNRAFITHTLSNPLVLNKIHIAILKPDLTAPNLDINSAVLIKIQLPQQPVPNIMADTLINLYNTDIEKQTMKEVQQAQKQINKSEK
tara:strand:+ start:4386 stop:6611 length:2226 start_codon:yes stop_codon:yes gene_type:complete